MRETFIRTESHKLQVRYIKVIKTCLFILRAIYSLVVKIVFT